MMPWRRTRRPGKPGIAGRQPAFVTQASAKVEKLGGKICKSKTAVPGMGYFAICMDTEGNTFALWEMNNLAK
jgi:hypothetical protein